jgi:hypothetical protein
LGTKLLWSLGYHP